MKKILLLLFAAAALSCAGRSNKNDAAAGPLSFKAPEPPAMMTSDHERFDWVMKHYWDNFDFTDERYVHTEIAEQAFADYVYVAGFGEPRAAARSMNSMMNSARADTTMYRYFMELSDKYLYDPNSPFMNEELYIPVLENIMSFDELDELEKLRPASQLRMALKNRRGTVASDVEFTDAHGRKHNLHSVKADYVLFYINNPDCNACRQITDDLKSSPVIENLVGSGKLKVVAVYPDEDLAAWKNNASHMDPRWVNAYDHGLKMRDEDIYDLKAIPTMYLLDENKAVLMKDAVSVMQLEEYFTGIAY